jgi:hypothetical protein
MDRWSYLEIGSLRKAHTSEPGATQVRVMPFGPYGGGQITSHPIGLVIVIGFIAMALVGIPEARGFFCHFPWLGRYLWDFPVVSASIE